MQEFHILNGDNLKDLLKDEFTNLFVMREALVQGKIDNKDINSFFKDRAEFISKEYKACTINEYNKTSVEELKKIKKIEENSSLNFWFGADLFCQINFWFLINYLEQKAYKFYLVLPRDSLFCSSFNKNSYKYRIFLEDTDLKAFSKLWLSYQEKNFDSLKKESKSLEKKFPFIKQCIEAIINQKQMEKEIISLYKKEQDFTKVFKYFCDKYKIYSFGDLQIKYICKIA